MLTTRLWNRGRSLIQRHAALFWVALLTVLLAIFLEQSRAEVLRTVEVVRTAGIGWLGAALVIQTAIVSCFALILGLFLRRLGHQLGWRVTLQAYLQRVVVGALAPVSGPASSFAFVRFVGERGVPGHDALLALALNGVVGYGSFIVLLIPVLIMLEVQHQASSLLLAAALVLIALFLLLVSGLLLALRPAGPPAWLARHLPNRLAALADSVRGHRIRPRDFVLPFLAATLIEIGGVALLYCSLRAIGQTPTLATALTGYAVGTTFLIAAPFFSGIGPVELGMVFALRQFGIPGEAAVAATLLYRGVELWLPLVVGLSVPIGSRPELRRGAVHVPAVMTFLTGLFNVLSVLAPRLPHRLSELSEYSLLTVHAFSRTFVLLAGFFLMFLSYALWRRKRVAWFAALSLLAGSIPAHLVKAHDRAVAVLALLSLALLLWNWRQFRVRSDVPTMRLGLIRFALSLLFALGYGTTGFFLIDRRAYGIDFGLAEALERSLRAFFSLGETGLTPRTHYAQWFEDSLSIVGIVSLGYALFSLIRPVVWRRTTHEHERRQAQALIEDYGDSSLDFFKQMDDKFFFFASSGRAVAAYGLAQHTAVVLGDPVAASADDVALLLEEFLDFCDTNGWRVAFHQASPHRLPAYRAAGLSVLKIGEEAIVDLDGFSLQGRAFKSLRWAVNHLEKAGYRVVFSPPPQPAERLAQLRQVSDEWLRLNGRRERHFSMGEFEEAYIRDSPVFAVEDGAGNIVAFANLIPDGVAGEATIDLMRRRAEPDGVMDLLFVRMFEELRRQGYHRFSLGLAPFANVGTDPDAPIAERLIHQLYEHLNRVFSYKGLRGYKDKFKPIWEPRYLVYRSEGALPLIALAIVRLTE